MFDRFDTNDTYCILCWVREAIDPLASLTRKGIVIGHRTFKTLKGIERTHKVAFGW